MIAASDPNPTEVCVKYSLNVCFWVTSRILKAQTYTLNFDQSIIQYNITLTNENREFPTNSGGYFFFFNQFIHKDPTKYNKHSHQNWWERCQESYLKL